MKSMTWSKRQFAVGCGAAALLVAGAAIVAVSQTNGGDKLTTAEIFKKAQDAYASLSSYSDEGKTVAAINGQVMTTTFTIQLARPNSYRIEWEQPVHSGYTNKGVVWSAGNGNFLATGNGNAQRQEDQDTALAGATGISSGAAATIPGTFFRTHWGNPLGGSTSDKVRQADEKIGDVDCYVFASELKGTRRTLWIGKNDFLIYQVRTETSPEALKAALDQAERITGVRPQELLEPQGVTMTETHMNIVVNKEFSPDDFRR